MINMKNQNTQLDKKNSEILANKTQIAKNIHEVFIVLVISQLDD